MQSIEYDHPDWSEAGRAHDWRNYVLTDLRIMWDTFTLDQKRAIAENADELASREEWI